MTEEPISLSGLRRRLEFIKDQAVPTTEMTADERGQVTGAKNILMFVLAELDRVHCSCTAAGDAAQPPTAAAVLRLIAGGADQA